MDLAVDLKPASSGADQADVRASPSLKCYVAEGSSFNTSGSKMQDEWILSLRFQKGVLFLYLANSCKDRIRLAFCMLLALDYLQITLKGEMLKLFDI